MLDRLPATDKSFYNELSAPHTYAQRPTSSTTAGSTKLAPALTDPDEPPFSEPNPQDDCEAVPTAVIIDHICNDHIVGSKYREDDGTLSLVLTKADLYGPCDSNLNSDSEDEGSGYEDHASDEDWEPTMRAGADNPNDQQVGSEFESSAPLLDASEMASTRAKRTRKPVNLDGRFRFWQEK